MVTKNDVSSGASVMWLTSWQFSSLWDVKFYISNCKMVYRHIYVYILTTTCPYKYYENYITNIKIQ